MQFNVVFIATALLACAAPAMSVTLTLFAGSGCTGQVFQSGDFGNDVCLTLGSGSVKSIGYANVPSQIQFFESGGAHDNCSNGATLVFGGGSGCATAPDGVNLESVFAS